MQNAWLPKRLVVVSAVIVVILLAAGAFGLRIAAQRLKHKIIEALGPSSEIAEVRLGWSSVELIEVVIHAPKGWPAARTFYAERVKAIPNLASLWTHQTEIASITVEDPYLSVLRTPGKLVILPGLLERRKKVDGSAKAARSVVISKVVLRRGAMDIFDATVSMPPLRVRLEEIEAELRDIAPADLAYKTRFELAALAKGRSRDGRVKVTGWVAAAGRDSSSHITLKDVDLASLQPYLVKRGDARVSQGSLDLDLKSEVRNHQLDGIGKMILRDLEFAPSQSYFDTFMGMQRRVVLAFLKNHQNAIDIDFTLAGDIRHPNFSLNETLATRVATGMAGQLGVGIQGVAEGLESLGRNSLEGAATTAGAIGSALKGLFGGADNRQETQP